MPPVVSCSGRSRTAPGPGSSSRSTAVARAWSRDWRTAIP